MASIILRAASRAVLPLAGAAMLVFGALDVAFQPLGAPSMVAVAWSKDGGGSGKGGESGGKSGGDDGGRSGSGKSGTSGGDDGKSDGGDDGGEGSGKGRGKSEKARDRAEDSRDDKAARSYMKMASKRGAVAWARVTKDSAELRYSDGWSESVQAGRYRLRDRSDRVVAERPARRGDYNRLSAAAKAR